VQRSDERGPVQDLIAAGSDDATSIPIPLIILAGIAGLLMAAGAASLIAKRSQRRRVTVPVQPAPPARGR
jgi:nitrate reductase gamma subunit